MKEQTKASMGMLLEFILLVAAIALVSVMVFQITAQTRSDLLTNTNGCNTTNATACGAGYNATIDVDEALGKIPDNMKILATAVVFSVIIYVIMKVIPMAGVGRSDSF